MTPTSIAQKLIQCKSDTSSSNHECAELLEEMLKERGFQVKQTRYQDLNGCPKIAISAKLPGSKAESGGIAFFSHSDVVSSEGWHVPQGYGPNDAVAADGRLWGRGACDMKGPMAALLSAIDASATDDQDAPLYFFITGDEECGMQGAGLLAESCPWYREAALHGAVGVITEPTNLQVVSMHKGGYRIRVTAHGVAAHSSTAQGLNANWQLIPWLHYLSTLQESLHTDPSLRNEAFDPPTLCPNIVLSNQPAEANITVSRANCDLFIRTMPDTKWQEWIDRLVAKARFLQLEVKETAALPPMHTSGENSFVRQSLKICGQATPLAASYATDGCCYTDFSNLIVLGPGDIQQAHRCDEWIALDQLQRGAELYRRFIQEFTILTDSSI
jgi:acetylornithine deacetylase